eukprot:CAMPEP_0181218658 /NCGR_PEP_ID=MMETSP1096-20121128/27815_1 /TAXON_ID=156174 ORGANISM="Chrysochromulina ericina, Strain CCMP281" /NCGR_SAMPLE_ID=MMETSP1096 /ASSEMBLY_ACC=CAM_ASM_000453 /LENGTH=73 /DNA_ID=CAMNT_0023310897 /DNA_START=359 /DNA_END=577 /DNA_ORIENTATION=+
MHPDAPRCIQMRPDSSSAPRCVQTHQDSSSSAVRYALAPLSLAPPELTRLSAWGGLARDGEGEALGFLKGAGA